MGIGQTLIGKNYLSFNEIQIISKKYLP